MGGPPAPQLLPQSSCPRHRSRGVRPATAAEQRPPSSREAGGSAGTGRRREQLAGLGSSPSHRQAAQVDLGVAPPVLAAAFAARALAQDGRVCGSRCG